MTHQLDAEFRAAAVRGELVLPTCQACGRRHWYPLPRCPHCQRGGWTWQPAPLGGTLYSWTVIRHAFHPDLAGQLPYVVGLVEPDGAPGVHFVTNIVDCDPAELAVGMRVTAEFRPPVWADHPMPVFTPQRSLVGSRPVAD